GTSSGRPKSDAEDYRYFPEPDLVPVAPSRAWVEEIRAALPELPAARRRRLLGEWGFSDLEMRDVINAGALDLIEQTVAAGASAQSARKWWMGELARVAKDREVEIEALSITPVQVAELQGLVDGKKINDKIAKQVLGKVLDGAGDPSAIVEAEGLAVVSDDSVLTSAVDQAIADNPDVVAKIQGGKVQAIGALIGPIMKATRGQADAGRVREIIMDKLGVS
ncbi:MAG TPA: Asp-tRNA(Asn)/Glu-tRNA(Gln) amidotransferase GatCAB subunit B, partial [Candidatus Brachybacterium intestinipullorum]|nr:Asp-tRNA(Asn)/Glu-tRNA(Gln) amidotransferase GatCAB subunit B [Candidatus Brachybacterium intestinipullorum]